MRQRDEDAIAQRLLADLGAVHAVRSVVDNPERIDAGYNAAFRNAGLDLDALPAEKAGAWIDARSKRVELAVYLDNWAFIRRSARALKADWRHLVAAARAADPEPWRDALRAKVLSRDPAAANACRALADNTAALDDQPAESLILLALELLNTAGDHARAERVLRRAWLQHPGDFWVNYQLAQAPGKAVRASEEFYPRPDDEVRYLTAAVSIRPSSAMAYRSLGFALRAGNDPSGADEAFREAVRLERIQAQLYESGLETRRLPNWVPPAAEEGRQPAYERFKARAGSPAGKPGQP